MCNKAWTTCVYMDLLCPANRPFPHHHMIKVWHIFFPCRSDMQDCPHQYTYPNMFLLQAPGRPFSCPVCSRRSALSLSFATVSSLIMDRSTWEGRKLHIIIGTYIVSAISSAWDEPFLVFLDLASGPSAFLLPVQVWAACSFLSAGHTWDTIRGLHAAKCFKCFHWDASFPHSSPEFVQVLVALCSQLFGSPRCT